MTSYTVKAGDTLSSIAKKYKVTLQQILAANPKFTTDPKFQGGNMIWAGTIVKIPAATTTPPVTKPPTTPPATTTPPPAPSNPVQTPPKTDPNVYDVVTPTPTWTTPMEAGRVNPINIPVRSAPIDTVAFIDDAASVELMTDLLFEDIGGQELLTLSRNDTVNGQSVVYQPIKNLNILQEEYNPTTLLRLQDTSDKYFANFVIDLKEKIPNVGSGLNGKNYLVTASTGDLVIEFVNLKADEQVQVQIATSGTIEELGI